METCPVAVFVGFPLTPGVVVSIARLMVGRYYLHIQSPSLATFLKLLKLSSRPSSAVSFFSSTMICSRCVSRSMSRNINLELSARTERILPDAVRPDLCWLSDVRTEHRDHFWLCFLDCFILGVEVSDGEFFNT
jgi:hypothetical protein